MKKVLLLLLLCTNVYGQWIKIPQGEYTSLMIGVDPCASHKEGGLDLFGEFTFVSNFGYIKVSTQIFPALTGGYYDVTGGAGFNQESSINLDWLHIDWINFNVETRIYEGIRIGAIYRGESIEYGKGNPYGLFGMDLGIDFKITDTFSFGGKFTNDWRDDMRYSSADPKWVQSGVITATFKLHEL